MAKLNHHFQKLQTSYLFPEIEKRVAALPHSALPLLNLGVGNVTHPLFPNVVEALIKASQEMGNQDSLRGYGPSQGYDFLRKAISENDYTNISYDEIFISDGINSDISSIQEIFSPDNRVAVMDPAYPVYVDTNVMAGRTRPFLKTGGYGGITYLPCTEKNSFQPLPPNSHVDLIYLCSPSNPTGVALGRDILKKWIDYAKKEEAVILFDAAYEAFITSDAPRSIYEIEGALDVAIEFKSFSKAAGFTGLRCSYTVIPHALKIKDAGKIQSLHSLWTRRVETKSNGVSYPIQRAAEALYTPEGKEELKKILSRYSSRAKTLLEGLGKIGYTVYGGVDAPYVWCKTPPKIGSWEFFNFILEQAQVITLPGLGFGKAGDPFIRFSAFAKEESIEQTLLRFKALA